MKQRSFTLLELLIVVAVLLVLAAALLPLLNRAQDKSRRAQCANNQRLLVSAYTAYAADADGSLLRAAQYPGGQPAVVYNEAGRLARFADDYLEGRYDVFDNPNWPGYFRTQLADYRAGRATRRQGEAVIYTYGYLGAEDGQELSWRGPDLRFDPDRHDLLPAAIPSKISSPSHWPLVADVACQALSLAGDAEPNRAPNWWIIAPHFQRGGGLNLYARAPGTSSLGELAVSSQALVDGHVQWLDPDEMLPVLEEGNRRRYLWGAAR